ncbi:hypothetical protein [Halosegnis rubeus]|uniref:hypothetical protein n=1 Tax=Halosegnis rubeus TaxID=2212850 RepID=UPI001CED61A1|nr:hypothetical protein [Halosegnis rubeus]
MNRRDVLGLLSTGFGITVSGCGSRFNGGEEDEKSPRSVFFNNIPKDPVEANLKISRTEDGKSDFSVAISVDTIPEDGEYGSVNVYADPNDKFVNFAPEDTISIDGLKGFSQVENDISMWDGETDSPQLMAKVRIGDRPIGFGSNEYNLLVRMRSHIAPFVRMISAVYTFSDPEKTADNQDINSDSEPIDVAASVQLEQPAYPAAEIQDYQPAREEHNFAVIGDFNQYKLTRDSYEINCISVPKSDLSCDRTEPVQMIDMAKRLYAPSSEISELNIREFEFTGFPRPGFAGDGQFTVNHSSSVRTWLHEFIHTEQLFSLSEEMAWFTEASAHYFDRLALLQFSELEFDSFYVAYADFVADQPVAEIGSKHQFPPRLAYDASSIVAALDAIIRQRTEKKTVVNVFQRMNNSSGEVTFARFADIVAEVIGERLDPWLESNIREEANVTIPEDPQLFIKQERSDDIEASPVECIEYRK